MYCSSCGSTVVQGSSYCNRCGIRVASGKGRKVKKPAKITPDGLVWALVSVLTAGFGLFIGLMTVMKKELDFSTDVIVMFAAVTFALIVSVCVTFIWLLVRSTRDDDESELEDETAARLGEAGRAHQLEAPPASIVENTTRTFDPELRERRAEMKSLDTSGRSRSEISP